MAIVKHLSKGERNITMQAYEALSTIEQYKKYNIIDYPETSITNTQMTFALTCDRLFPAGSTFVCSDSGTYIQNHTYRIKVVNDVKSWEDITDKIIDIGNAQYSKESQIYPAISVTNLNNIYNKISNGEVVILEWNVLANTLLFITEIEASQLANNRITINIHGNCASYEWSSSSTGNINPTIDVVIRKETIYDADSNDPVLNWGKTAGIINEKITGKDFSKYKYLICEYSGNWGTATVFVNFEKVSTQGYKFIGNNVYDMAIDNSNLYIYSAKVQVNYDKTEIESTVSYYKTSSTSDITNIVLRKIVGVY